MTGIEGRARKAQEGEALKPNYNELLRIEADYDPEKDVITNRVYGLLSIAERPRRNVIGRVSE